MKCCIKTKKTYICTQYIYVTPMQVSHLSQHFSMLRANRRPVLFSRGLTPLGGRGCVTWTQWSLPDAYKKITPLTSGCVVHPGCMAYMLAQAEANVASACMVLHLKICHLSQMGFYNVLGENVRFSVWGSHGGDYNRYLFGAQELTTWNGNVFSDNTQHSQPIPDLDKHLL